MQGFIQRQIPIWLRRGLTMIPALIVAAIGLDPTRTLVISQVVLSFGIPVALIPLVMFTRQKGLDGHAGQSPGDDHLGLRCAPRLSSRLNGFLLYQTLLGD